MKNDDAALVKEMKSGQEKVQGLGNGENRSTRTGLNLKGSKNNTEMFYLRIKARFPCDNDGEN